MTQLETLSIEALHLVYGGADPLPSSTEVSGEVDPVTRTVKGTAKTTSTTTERNQCYSDRATERSTWIQRNLTGIPAPQAAEITRAQELLCK